MKDSFSIIQELLQERADYQARLNLIPYDGTPEIKENGSGKYLYIRKRVGGRLTSTYVDLYTDEQKKVLSVRPGITDYASIEYVDENEILGNVDNPEVVYVNQILPDKIKFNMKYIENKSVNEYFKIIFLTIIKIFR